MNRDDSDNESLLDKAKDAVTTVLGERETEETVDTSAARPTAEVGTVAPGREMTTGSGPSDLDSASEAGTGVVDYNRAAGVDTSMSDAREGVALGDFGIAGQTDAYDGADVVAEQADTPERHDLD